jgi:hypothetical protein
MEEERTGHKILIGKSEEIPALTTLRREWENNIKKNF